MLVLHPSTLTKTDGVPFGLFVAVAWTVAVKGAGSDAVNVGKGVFVFGGVDVKI